MKIWNRFKHSICVADWKGICVILLVVTPLIFVVNNIFGISFYIKEFEIPFDTIVKDVVIPLFVSFLFFIIINFLFIPKIKLGEHIRKIRVEPCVEDCQEKCKRCVADGGEIEKDDKEEFQFEFMLENFSHFIALDDLSISFEIVTNYSVCCFENKVYQDTLVFNSGINLPSINRQSIFNRKDKNNAHFIRIHIPREEIYAYLKLNDHIYRHILKRPKYNIDAFLRGDNTFRISVNGNSRYTGVKKTFHSKRYTKDDIKEGKGWDNLEVIPYEKSIVSKKSVSGNN